MKAAVLLLSVALGQLVVELSGESGESSDPLCPNVKVDLSRKPVEASSTCGDGAEYCYVDTGTDVVQCRNCEDEANVRNVVDGDAATHWISNPGVQAVNLTFSFLQPIHVSFMLLRTSKALSSKLPAKWEIHKSTDGGTSFVPWIYLANSSSLCPDGLKIDGIPNDNQIACIDVMEDQFTAIVALFNQQILSWFDDECGILESPLLRNFLYATDIRLVFLKVNTERFGDIVDRSQIFYAISHFAINGLCDCNGYADECIINSTTGLYHCVDCVNGTCGEYCEQCCPLYNNAPYTQHEVGCVECDCSGNAESCEYNETLGVGVCISCQNNTTGVNCEKCLSQHYLDPAYNSCQPCFCNEDGITDDGQCDELGQCHCKEGYVFDLKCNHCPNGSFFNGDNCSDCMCPTTSTGVQLSCDPFSGQCACPTNTVGLRCAACIDGTWDLDIDFGCKPCGCDALGAIGSNCDTTGQCRCRDSFTGLACDQCVDTYYLAGGNCVTCDCHLDGSETLSCDPTTGICTCKEHVMGQRCNQCEAGYYNLSAENGCLPCSCNVNGSTSNVCDNVTGQCDCLPGKSGRVCIGCEVGYYVDSKTISCLPCACSKNGSVSSSCRNNGQCDCKQGVEGERCDRCAVGYWGFSAAGCTECDCFFDGTNELHVCNAATGKCICAEGISGDRCTRCVNIGHFVVENHTCNACDGCSEGLIDQLMLLVDRMQSTINFLSNNGNTLNNSYQFNQLKNKSQLAIREVMEWATVVNMSLCRLGVDVYCTPATKSSSLLRNYTRLSELAEELKSFFPELVKDVDDMVILTNQTFVVLNLFKANVTTAYNRTEAVLDQTNQMLSEVVVQLMNVMELLNKSEATLVNITGRNGNFSIISSMVDESLEEARIRHNGSQLFLHSRMLDNITLSNISSELKILQAILQDEYLLSLNVSSTINDTVIYNRYLDGNITGLQEIINSTAMLNDSIAAVLNQTWEVYMAVYTMWQQAELLLQDVMDAVSTLNVTAVPCAMNETELFQKGLEDMKDSVTRAHNYSVELLDSSSLIINESTFGLQYGERFLLNVSQLSYLNFTAMHLNIEKAIDLAQNAIAKINEANLSSLAMDVSYLSNSSKLLSQQVTSLVDQTAKRKNESNVLHDDSVIFQRDVMAEHTTVATSATEVSNLNSTTSNTHNLIDSAKLALSQSEAVINESLEVAAQVEESISHIAANIDNIEANVELISNNTEEIINTYGSLVMLSPMLTSSIDSLGSDVDDLISENMNMINDIDEVLKDLTDIHQEISLMNAPLNLVSTNEKASFISLQPPPGRSLSATTQYEAIDLFLNSDQIRNNTLLFYVGPAKAKDEESDEVLDRDSYLAFLLQATSDGRNELKLVYKPSAAISAQQFVLKNSNFKEKTGSRVHISRVGSAFRLALRNGATQEDIEQDSATFVSGSLLFTGNNRTAFYVGGKPDNIELPSLVDSASHYSGIASLLLYNNQIWGLWDVRDSFSADFTGGIERNRLITNLDDARFSMSFSGDGYLFTESLFDTHSNRITISIKPFSTEGLVMFAYDDKDNASLEIFYSKGNLGVAINDNQPLMVQRPLENIEVFIIFSGNVALVGLGDSRPQRVALSRRFNDYTTAKSWFGGISGSAARRPRITEHPFFGCVEIQATGRSISFFTEHFTKYYINSNTQKRLSLGCLNTQYAHSVSFNGNGSLEFSASSLRRIKNEITDENNKNFTSFSFEFAVAKSQSSAGLLMASTRSSSVIITLVNGFINVTLSDRNGNQKQLTSSRQLELGVSHFLLLHLNYLDTSNGYQLFIDNELEDSVVRFGDEWRLDVFSNSRLLLGTNGQETMPKLRGCMKNFVIQFRLISFLSSVSPIAPGVVYHECTTSETTPEEPPLLAVVAPEPMDDRCPPATMNFTLLSGIQSCFVSSNEYSLTIQAIPERPNGLLLALANSTNLIYAIGTREGKGLYYANNRTEDFGDVCPTLIALDIVSSSGSTMITGSVSVNVTQHGQTTLYIGQLPEGAIADDRLSFLQCYGCDSPPGFLGQLEIQEINLNSLVNSTGSNVCQFNT